MRRWKVEVRDGLTRTAEVTDWLDQIVLKLRFNQASKFTLDGAPALSSRLPLGAGVYFSRDGQPVASGIVTEPAEERSAGQRQVTVHGIDDLGRLDGRIVLPDPTLPPDDPDQPNVDRQTGPAETVIKHYVTANAGPDAITFTAPTPAGGTVDVDLAIEGLTVATDVARGETVTGRGRYHPLLTYCATLAARGALGMQAVYQPAAEQIVFDVYEPRDLTALVKIGVGFGNLEEWRRRIALPEATVAVAGGRGEGADRLVRVMADPIVEVVGPWLTWLDQRNAGDEDDPADQQAALDDALTDALDGLDDELSITARDTYQIQFGRDYRLGDLVTVVIENEPIVKVIDEVEITVTPDGEQVRPSVGGSADRRWDLYDRLGAIESRLADLARS